MFCALDFMDHWLSIIVCVFIIYITFTYSLQLLISRDMESVITVNQLYIVMHPVIQDQVYLYIICLEI